MPTPHRADDTPLAGAGTQGEVVFPRSGISQRGITNRFSDRYNFESFVFQPE